MKAATVALNVAVSTIAGMALNFVITKDAEKAIDDQIKKYNEFKDKLSEVMDDIGKSWKDYQKELEYTAQIQKMSLSQMEGSLDGYHKKIVASLNTGSAITSIQNLITNLESLINTLTKVNNLYSAIKTGEYKDLGTKGLWNTIKGFFGKGKSENVNKSFKDTFDAAKKAFNAGKKQLTDTATTGTNDVINAMINQIKTSGNGLIETFGGIWERIKGGAQSLFNGSGEGGGIVSTVVNGFKAVGNAVSKSKIGSTILGGVGKVGTTLVKGGGKLLAGAGKLIGTAGSALAAAGPAAIPIAGAAALGIYGGTKAMKNQKKIWSNKEDSVGSVGTKTWTVNVVEFYLESTFDDTLVYSGEVTFRYTPYGNIAKTINFTIDGKTLGSTTSSVTGRQLTYAIPAQTHGAHLVEVSMTAEINGKQVTSNKIVKDIMWAIEGNATPIISCATKTASAKQYSNVAINYTVYDPSSSTATVTLEVDGAKTATLTVGRTVQTWTWKSADIGTHTLKIVCGSVSKTISVEIKELGITIEPVKTNLAFDFNPAGKTNADETRLWTDGNNKLTVSDNFDWSNGGYQLDEDGDTYFCVKAGTTANISYKLFGDDAKKLGKNFKLVFKTTNVKNYDATALTCLNGGIGLNIQAQKVTLTSEQNSISLPTCEDDFMEFEFNILPDSQYKEMVLWLDGIPCRVELYDASDNFTQASPVSITIGSPDCDVQVYRMKSYMMNLTDDEILDNFIADAKNAEEMIERYTRNDITDVSGELNPDLLAEKCPDLRIIKISAPTFTTGKKNEVPNTTIQHIYKNGRAVEDNWTATGSHKGQGTSSNAYGESGRNIDIDCSGGFTFGDESTGSKYAFTENSVGEKYFNIKVNVASSENANNALLADEFNEFNPYIRQARKDNPKVRDTMAFYPCVVFIQETDTANATVFKDGQWHFYACGDFGNSKKNSDTMGMDPNNHKEVIVEIDNNTDAQTRFLSGDFSEETWDGDHSFEFRYINKNCSEQEIQDAKNAWIRVQNWVVNADDEEFKKNFENYFVKDTHNSVKDAGDNSSNTTFAYSKSGMNYGDYSWLAGWNGYELRAINKNQFATAGHNHDSRYYTESEIDSKLDGKSNVGHTHDYLPTAGGTMNGDITFSDSSHGKIYSGPTDNVNGPGGDLNNIVIESWNGLSFTTGCPNQTYTGKTAVGIDCREGVVKAARFDGTLTGTAATLGGGGNPYAPMTFNWSGKDGQPTWLWGGEDGTNMYVYNPGNFSVNWAQGAANGVYANGFKSSRGGYIRFCNGLQICWGENNKNTTAAVFDVPFKTVDYTLVLGGTDDLNNAWYIASRTTTGFTPKQNGFAGVTNWIAIGRWN